MPLSGALLTLRRQGFATPAERVSIDGWTLHSGATDALTHHFAGREGSTFVEYVRIANDFLSNTEVANERAAPSLAKKAGQFRSREATLEAWRTPE